MSKNNTANNTISESITTIADDVTKNSTEQDSIEKKEITKTLSLNLAEEKVLDLLKSKPYVLEKVAEHFNKNQKEFKRIITDSTNPTFRKKLINLGKTCAPYILSSAAGTLVGGLVVKYGNFIASTLSIAGAEISTAVSTFGTQVGAALATVSVPIWALVVGIVAILALASIAIYAYKNKEEIKSVIGNFMEKISIKDTPDINIDQVLKDKNLTQFYSNCIKMLTFIDEENFFILKGIKDLPQFPSEVVKLMEELKKLLKDNKDFEKCKGKFNELKKLISKNPELQEYCENLQDKFHKEKKGTGPMPSSILSSGSLAHNKFLAGVKEDYKSNAINLLQNIAQLDSKYRDKFYEEFSQECSFLKNLDKEGLYKKNKDVIEIESVSNQFSQLVEKDLTQFNESVKKLQEDQNKRFLDHIFGGIKSGFNFIKSVLPACGKNQLLDISK